MTKTGNATTLVAQRLEVMQGPLVDSFWELDPNTVQDASQIVTLRTTQAAYRPVSFWPADLALYTREHETVVVYLARLAHNVVMKPEAVEDKTDELIRNRNMFLSPKEEQTVKAGALKIDLAALELLTYNHEMSYFEIMIARYETLRGERLRLAQWIYGQNAQWHSNMQCLTTHGAKTLRLYVLNPEYVMRLCDEHQSIARLGRLDRFPRSNFRAVGRNIGDEEMGLCGYRAPDKVRGREVRLADAFHTVLGNLSASGRHVTLMRASALRESVRLHRLHGYHGYVSCRARLTTAFRELDSSTLLHAHEITTARRADEALRDEWFWTADFAAYGVEDGECVLYLASRENNLILRDENIDRAAEALISSRDFVVPRDQIDGEAALRIPYGVLRLRESSHEFSYAAIGLSHIPRHEEIAMRILEKVLGTEEFEINREFILQAGITEIQVFVLNPAYLRKKNTADTYLTRVCRLGMIREGSVFKAIGRGVSSPYVHLRGQLRCPAHCEQRNEEEIIQALERITRDPWETAQYLNRPIVSAVLGLRPTKRWRDD